MLGCFLFVANLLVNLFGINIIKPYGEFGYRLRLDFGRDVGRHSVQGDKQSRQIVGIANHRDEVKHKVGWQNEVS